MAIQQCPGCLRVIIIRTCLQEQPPVPYEDINGSLLIHVCEALANFQKLFNAIAIEDTLMSTIKKSVGRPKLTPLERIKHLTRKGAFVVDTITGCWKWVRFSGKNRTPCLWVDGRLIKVRSFFYEHLEHPLFDYEPTPYCGGGTLCVNPQHQHLQIKNKIQTEVIVA